MLCTAEGKPIRINSPAEAIKLKIGMVHQEFMLVPSLTVSENMMLREEPKKGIFINRAKACLLYTSRCV